MTPKRHVPAGESRRSAVRPRRRGVLHACLAIAVASAGLGSGHLLAQEGGEVVELPEPERTGTVSVEETIERRRSRREYGDAPLSLDDLAQLLWAGQGITDPREGYRAAPSAGALYPMELYVTAGDVRGLEDGVYRYRPAGHELMRTARGDRRDELAEAALDQRWVRTAPAVLVLSAVYARTEGKYGGRARRYVHMEAGAVAENLYLQAVARDLSTVLVGAFHDRRVQRVLELPDDHAPVGLMPVGHSR